MDLQTDERPPKTSSKGIRHGNVLDYPERMLTSRTDGEWESRGWGPAEWPRFM